MGSKTNVLVIGVWGFPGSWHLASYVSPEPPERIEDWDRLVKWKYDGRVVKAHSSLAAFTKALIDSGFNAHAVVYGLDTLAVPPPTASLADLIAWFYENDPQNYGDILGRAEKVLELYVQKYFEEVGLKPGIAEWAVTPGIGIFQLKQKGLSPKRYEFIGSPQNTLIVLELDLFDKLNTYKPEAIVLDISHGINFMPTLATIALHRVVRAYSALNNVDAKAIIVNSDPVTREGQRATIQIHIVEADDISVGSLEFLAGILNTPRFMEGQKYYKMLVPEKPAPELKKLENVLKEASNNYVDVAKTLLEASSYGIILYMVHRLTDAGAERVGECEKKLREHIREVVETRRVGVEGGGKNIKVVHDFSLDAQTILGIHYALNILYALAEKISRAKSRVRDLKKYRMVPLDYLKELAEDMGVSKHARTILANEIWGVERRVKLYRDATHEEIRDPTPYTLIYEVLEARSLELLDEDRRKHLLEELGERAEKKKCMIDERNFLAHAGLERNAVAVSVEEGKVFIGYHPECLEKIHGIIK